MGINVLLGEKWCQLLVNDIPDWSCLLLKPYGQDKLDIMTVKNSYQLVICYVGGMVYPVHYRYLHIVLNRCMSYVLVFVCVSGLLVPATSPMSGWHGNVFTKSPIGNFLSLPMTHTNADATLFLVKIVFTTLRRPVISLLHMYTYLHFL